jgi:S-adenosylmethionine:tRNA ribosyltransferase-isomerase
MHISEFDYKLPPELIAQQPLERRDASRLLVLDRKNRNWSDSEFTAISQYLRPNDVVVLNDTKVFPARLIGQRHPSGGRVEVLLVRELAPLLWEGLVRPGHRLNVGSRMHFGDSQLQAEVVSVSDRGLRVLRLACDESLDVILDQLGKTPLPPYIKRAAGSSREDRERYQTVYARSRGAIAAPTAGLHFTRRLLDQLQDQGVAIAEVTLHVGYGTFEPVRVEDIGQHRVGPEAFEISPIAAETINAARSKGGRVVAVGTTTTRALESAVNAAGQVEVSKGDTAVTIIPGYTFRITNALITNFHLPQSSLLLLVCAFADRTFVLEAYRHAVEECYRFYSYGDCMLIR